jgi:hypothetical protein
VIGQPARKLDKMTAQPFAPAALYRNLQPDERQVWDRFIRAHAGECDECYYYVPVGATADWIAALPERDRAYARGQYAKRIDVVGRRGRDYIIFEVKPIVEHSAIGQLLYYLWAFRNEYQPAGAVYGALVAEEIEPDVKPLLTELRILFYEI